MRFILVVSFLALSTAPALADNIANCEVVLMERIEQEGLEGAAEVASFRSAGDFLASVYSEDENEEVLREIDGLPIRAVMCERHNIVPSLRDFPIAATGIPFMISQNFDSPDTGLTTIFFKNGKFQYSYKGSELNADIQAELDNRIEVYNFQPHELTEKEAAMKAKESAPAPEVEVEEVEAEEVEETLEDTFEVTTADILPSTDEWVDAAPEDTAADTWLPTDEVSSEGVDKWVEDTSADILPSTDEWVDVLPEETSTEILPWADDILAESTNQEGLDLE